MTITKLHPLTLNELRLIEEGTVICCGTAFNSKSGVQISRDFPDRKFVWQAIKGERRAWSIFYHWDCRYLSFKKEERIKDSSIASVLVPCEVDAMYCFE